MSSRRRAFAAAIAALLVVEVAALLVLVRRDGGSPPAPSAPHPVAAPAGSLRVGLPELPLTYNPFDVRARATAARQILAVVLPQLFDVAPDGSVHGRLIADGSVRTKGDTVTMHFVPGARWSDGERITAADVAFTWRTIRGSEWPGPDAGYDHLKDVGGSGSELRLRFDRAPLPGWQRLFSGDDYVLPRHRLDGKDLRSVWAAGPDVSGGPYLFKGFTPGLDVVLSANPQWWGAGRAVRDIRVLTVPDATTLQQLFERKQLDVAWMPAYTERIRSLRDVDGASVSVGPPGGDLVSVAMNTGAVGQGSRVAVLDLVDRDRFVKVLLRGEADIATSWGMVPRDPGWPRWFVDPQKARQASSQTLVFATADEQPMGALLTRAVQRRARGSGISFDAVSVGSEVLDGQWLPGGKFDAALTEEVEWPVPCWRCRFSSAFEGESNWSRADDYDDLAAKADAGDAGTASALERRLEEDGVVLPMWRPRAVVVSRGVKGIEANAWFPGPLYHVEDWSKS